MASLIERVVAHYDNRPVYTVEVPEWGEGEGRPLVVHYKAPTLATLSRARREAPGDELKAASVLVAQCALDASGNPLFKPMAWRDIFERADPAVVQRISAAIMDKVNFGESAVEAAEKN